MQVVSRRYVPIPVARKILESVGEAEGDERVVPLVARTLEYLTLFSKCDAEAAERAVKRLVEELKMDELAAVNLVNIAPETVHEARIIVEYRSALVPPEALEEAVRIIREECRGKGSS